MRKGSLAFLCDWAMPVNTRIWAARTAEGRAGWGQGPRPARPFGAPSRMAFWAVSLPYSLFQSQGQESIFSKITGSRRDSFKTPSNGLRRALAPTRRAGRQTGGGAVGTRSPGADPGPGAKPVGTVSWGCSSFLYGSCQEHGRAQAQWPVGSAEGACDLCRRGGWAPTRAGAAPHLRDTPTSASLCPPVWWL